jgi:hypothetical protein
MSYSTWSILYLSTIDKYFIVTRDFHFSLFINCLGTYPGLQNLSCDRPNILPVEKAKLGSAVIRLNLLNASPK